MVKLEEVHVTYKSKRRPPVEAVRGVSFEIGENEIVGLVGESGCGKTTLGYAMAGLLESSRHQVSGRILLDGRDILAMPEETLRAIRWIKFSMVLQGGMNAFNPVIKIKHQFADGIREHSSMTAAAIRDRIRELLVLVQLEPSVAEMYPYELSGGMKQRVAIAMALSLDPQLVIMDEPTTALDVVVQRAIVKTLVDLQTQRHFSVMFVSHDLGLVLEIAQRVVVMYAGQAVEINTAAGILHQPLHPYTKALMRCYVDPRADHVALAGIDGSPPDLSEHLPGCAFAPRCREAIGVCRTTKPPEVTVNGIRVLCHLYGQEAVYE